MAYDLLQRRQIARELGRAGGHVQSAQKRLKNEYETLRNISQSTIRRVMSARGFAAIIAHETKLLIEAEREAAMAVERDRARRAREGSAIEQLSKDARLLDQVREKLEKAISTWDGNAEADGKVLKAFNIMSRLVQRRAEMLLPAVADFGQATMLVEATSETLVAKLGQARAREVVKDIHERYSLKINPLGVAELLQPSNPEAR